MYNKVAIIILYTDLNISVISIRFAIGKHLIIDIV